MGAKPKGEADIELELRGRLDILHLELFQRTQVETTKRWTYESEIKRPYFHVTDLDEAQLSNWRKYLDFEESEGDHARVKFLYERCLVTAANYDEFWFRYSRWTFGQHDKPKEVRNEALRNIYQRASCIFVPIAQPAIRLQFARFEESLGRFDVAIAIHEAILASFPNHLETMTSLVNVHRRQSGLDAALEVLVAFLQSTTCTPHSRGALAAEQVRLISQFKNNADAARRTFQEQKQACLESEVFWTKWLEFEILQSTLASDQSASRQRVQAVYDTIRKQASLSVAVSKDLTSRYLNYLVENGSEDAMVEFMTLDKDVHGPPSVSQAPKLKSPDASGDAETAPSSLAERRKGLGADETGAQQGSHVVATQNLVQRGEHGINGKISP